MKKLTLLILVSAQIFFVKSDREAKQFGWFSWGSDDKNTEKQQPLPSNKEYRPPGSQRPYLQRRTNQPVNTQLQENLSGKFPKQASLPRPGVPKRNYPTPPPHINQRNGPKVNPTHQQVKPRRVEQLQKRKLLAPIIISSYAHTNIQGHGNKVKDVKKQYQNINAISNKIEDKIPNRKYVPKPQKQTVYENEVITRGKFQSTVSTSTTTRETPLPTVSTTTSTTTTTTKRIPTTVSTTEPTTVQKAEDELTTLPATDNDILEYEAESPYLPEIPGTLDEEFFGSQQTPNNRPSVIIEPETIDTKISSRKINTKSEDNEVQNEQLQSTKPVRFPDEAKNKNRQPTREKTKQPLPQEPLKPSAYPLGKPYAKPFQKEPPRRQKPEESSFFDFLPFWNSKPTNSNPKSSKPTNVKPTNLQKPIAPRRQLPPRKPAFGVPTVVKVKQTQQPNYPAGLQAPLLLKVDSPQVAPGITTTQTQKPLLKQQNDEENVIRENERIDKGEEELTETSDSENTFIVLPSPIESSQKPKLKDQLHTYNKHVNEQPRPNRPNVGRRPPPPSHPGFQQALRPQKHQHPRPLSMTSQPVIGLPEVPPSRKQSPFIAKRPPLPPKIAKFGQNIRQNGYKKPPTLPLKRKDIKKPIKPTKHQHKKAQHLVPKRPVIKNKDFTKQSTFKQGTNTNSNYPLKTKLKDEKESNNLQGQENYSNGFSLIPNGVSKPASDIASHLSSLLNSFFSTTASPVAPAPSLPSLVEDTEFADIVRGYRPSDDRRQNNNVKQNTQPSTLTNKIPTAEKNTIESSSSVFDELDSLSAPLAQGREDLSLLEQLTIPKTVDKEDTPESSPDKTTTTSTTIVPKLLSTNPPVASEENKLTTTVSSISVSTSTQKPTESIVEVSTESQTQYPPQIQEIVDEYQNKVHVVPQDTSVLKTIQKNFEQKKNIFEQFVTFTEEDKRFTPHKEVLESDWILTGGAPVNLEDKQLIYQTIPPTNGLIPTSSTVTPTEGRNEVSEDKRDNFRLIATQKKLTYPSERNAEGGFQPMIRPLHSPLLS